MTTLLETAFEKASSLPEIEQNRFAKLLIAEIESEKEWDRLFGESEEILAKMADIALEDYNNGKTKPLTQEQLWSPIPIKTFGNFTRSYHQTYKSKPKNSTVSFQTIHTMQVCILSAYTQVDPSIRQGLQKTTEP